MYTLGLLNCSETGCVVDTWAIPSAGTEVAEAVLETGEFVGTRTDTVGAWCAEGALGAGVAAAETAAVCALGSGLTAEVIAVP